LAEKVPLIIEILEKQHRGSFLWDTLYNVRYTAFLLIHLFIDSWLLLPLVLLVLWALQAV